MVRTAIEPTPERYKDIHNNILALINIKSPALMQVLKVVETRGKRFQVDFEYFGESLRSSNKMSEPTYAATFKEMLWEFCRLLVENRIKSQILFDNIGLTK